MLKTIGATIAASVVAAAMVFSVALPTSALTDVPGDKTSGGFNTTNVPGDKTSGGFNTNQTNPGGANSGTTNSDTPSNTSGSGGGGGGGGSCASAVDCITSGSKNAGGSSEADIGSIIKSIVDILLFIIAAVAVIMIIIGGIRYTTSQGDQGAVASAKNTIMYAVIGLAVAIFAYAIVAFVIDQLAKGGGGSGSTTSSSTSSGGGSGSTTGSTTSD